MIRLKSLLILVLVLFVWSCQQPKEKQVKKPNILFLFADDYTFEAIHALGNEVIATPNLDRLVNGGTTFTHAYNMGGWNGAICVASRAMMISGRHVWRAQDVSKKWTAGDSLSLQQTWGKLMEKAGYSTYMTGKWHVEAPAETVFQVAKHIRPGMPNDFRGELGKSVPGIREALRNGEDISDLRPEGYYRPLSENDTSWSSSDPNNGGYWEGGKHWSEVVKDDALAFLDDAQKKENPFFMYIAFNAPHDPRQAPQSFLDKYPLEDIPLPENWLPEYPYKDDIGNSMGLRDEALAPFPRTELAIKTHRKEYYAIITHLDEQIGKILDALEASGELENTYIFFTGDHGLAVGHHGLIGKQSLFDHSIRVPFMAMGPDLPAGNKVDNDIYLQDVMATSLELAGVEKPDYVEFNSFLSLAKNETQEGAYEQGIYGAYVNYQRMIRKDGYKLLVYPKINKVLLFDLENDPLEMNDLAENPEQANRVKGLFEDLLKLQNEMGDDLDLTDIYQSL